MSAINVKDLTVKFPKISELIELKESSWFNPEITTFDEAIKDVGLDATNIKDASDRLKRFAPYLCKAFPETAVTNGIIESEIISIDNMKKALEEKFDTKITGKLLLKKDSHLPISGSIKARGGIYEVLFHAEDLAIKAGLLKPEDDYSKLFSEEFKNFFKKYKIAVGSTGNLGLSIGIMSAKLGFNVSVHMSADAREWKKKKLRANGVNVVEYQNDYSVAVAQGREEAKKDPSCFFIDDENSKTLFLGYSVAGERLKNQLDNMGIIVDKNHPLFVYLPCGVGGGPGGVAFGIKNQYKDNAHCVFAEPTHSPCMYLGVYTGLHEKISVQDIGIDNVTAADGLAVGRPSGFVGRAMHRLIDGYYTISDNQMYRLLAMLNKNEGVKLEPSALAGMEGPIRVAQNEEYLKRMGFDEKTLANATHIVWATGGGMVPDEEMSKYLEKGASL
ncbi:D-serine ammonia-lyase [Succinatimonas hippei]|uniref:D-serine ammonia-lyase n=1 Tax=Succinatimonas hippei TaxID=626938 RepID=UPI0020120C8F|nr:D-serine ammonia-lyase [Succinatimonas hippei]MCL1604144.1 D-serine ammonia-lyase [Succinatimonas hippei]